MAGMLHIRRGYFVHRYYFIFAHIRAYAIRPYTCSIKNDNDVFAVIVSFSPTSGRMRYAPTLVRLKTMLYWVMGWSHFRPHQGVCDTPLHPFDWNLGDIGLLVDSIFAHLRAYAIRPYTCSIDFGDWLVCVLVSFPPMSGRMRYAPTHVRLKSWPNTIHHCTCSMGIHTKKTAYYVSTTPWQKKNLFH